MFPSNTAYISTSLRLRGKRTEIPTAAACFLEQLDDPLSLRLLKFVVNAMDLRTSNRLLERKSPSKKP